ncbi:MAG: hypothetical protein FJZ58_06135 [Chlamydiae bacterium]|nr:hypothetical protein [Chlamydiota bacterium]
MKLVSITNHYPVVDFQEHQTVFYNKYLEKEMMEIGVIIPSFLQKQFAGKSVVKLGDVLFSKAFQEVYYKLYMNATNYHWE